MLVIRLILFVLFVHYQIQFSRASSFIDTSGCGTAKGCWLMPQGCSNADNSYTCDSIVTWTSKPEGVLIEIEGKVTDIKRNGGKYIAMAFSYDYKMGEDAVLECVSTPNGTVVAYLSFNDAKHNARMYQASKSMLKNTIGVSIDGRIACRTLRSYDPTDDINEQDRFKLFSLKRDSYYLLYAHGPIHGEGNELGIHWLDDGDSFPWIATDKMQVLHHTNINSMKHYDIPRSVQHQLVKVHGVFMLFGWWFCAAISLLFARFFKPSWPEKKLSGTAVWFQFHRGLMIASLILQCIAFAFIFIQAGDFKMCSYECSSNDYALKVHTILGVTCTAAALIQPFLALARPKPTSSNRPIFNWLHWFVGTGAFIVATVAIFLSTVLGKAGLRRNYNFVPDYLMAGYVASFILASILLELLSAYYLMKGGRKSDASIPLTLVNGPKANISNGADPPQKSKRIFSILQTSVLVCFVIVALGIIIALVVLISLD